MKKILFIILGIFLIGFISAQCQINNDFESYEDFNICSGRCKYEITAGNYTDCNSSISCYLTMAYPNGTLLDFFKQMNFNASGNEVFNYSFGNASNFPVGIYQGQMNCYHTNGWSDPINFEASISSSEISYISYTGDPAGYNIQLPSKEKIIDGILYTLRKKIWIFIIILGGLILMIVLVYDYKKHKFKKLVKRIKKELGRPK